MQFGTALRNALLDQIETTVGTAPLIRLYTGSAPASPSDSPTGTLLVTITAPSNWMAAASAGAKAKSGTWSAAAVATGTPGYFRVLDSSGATVHIQGTVGAGDDMELDSYDIVSGNTVTVTTFTLNAGNA